MSHLPPKWVRLALNGTNLIWKSPGFIPFRANLIHFEPKSGQAFAVSAAGRNYLASTNHGITKTALLDFRLSQNSAKLDKSNISLSVPHIRARCLMTSYVLIEPWPIFAGLLRISVNVRFRSKRNRYSANRSSFFVLN